jgi:hypothetical protein
MASIELYVIVATFLSILMLEQSFNAATSQQHPQCGQALAAASGLDPCLHAQIMRASLLCIHDSHRSTVSRCGSHGLSSLAQ